LDVRGNKERFLPVSEHKTGSVALKVADAFRGENYLARVIQSKSIDGPKYRVLINDNKMPKGKRQTLRLNSIIKEIKISESDRLLRNPNNPVSPVAYSKPLENSLSSSQMDEYAKVRRFSFWVGTVHLFAAILMVAYANKDFIIGITSTFAAGPPGCVEKGVCETFTVTNLDARLAYWVAGFSLLSALFHYITVSPGFYESYREQLEKGRNPYRWIEYSLSSTLMILIIMMLSGTTNLTALIGVGFANVGMILFGWTSEIMNPLERERTDWTPFIFGSIMGLGAWIALWGSLAINLEQLGIDWSAIPRFVWVIIGTQFTLFNIFALNHAWQLTNTTPEEYLRGEKNYIWLSLISKSLLAWSIYFNTLLL